MRRIEGREGEVRGEQVVVPQVAVKRDEIRSKIDDDKTIQWATW
jgi:hypothetical protein